MNDCCSNDQQLKWLHIDQCQLKTINSFVKVCDWGMSCERFGLWELDINIEWWERMVEMIDERQRKGDIKTKRLDIYKCSTRMSHKWAMRVR